MNDLDLCLDVVSRSSQPLCHIWKPLERERLGSMGLGVANGHVTRMVV